MKFAKFAATAQRQKHQQQAAQPWRDVLAGRKKKKASKPASSTATPDPRSHLLHHLKTPRWPAGAKHPNDSIYRCVVSFFSSPAYRYGPELALFLSLRFDSELGESPSFLGACLPLFSPFGEASGSHSQVPPPFQLDDIVDPHGGPSEPPPPRSFNIPPSSTSNYREVWPGPGLPALHIATSTGRARYLARQLAQEAGQERKQSSGNCAGLSPPPPQVPGRPQFQSDTFVFAVFPALLRPVRRLHCSPQTPCASTLPLQVVDGDERGQRSRPRPRWRRNVGHDAVQSLQRAPCHRVHAPRFDLAPPFPTCGVTCHVTPRSQTRMRASAAAKRSRSY